MNLFNHAAAEVKVILHIVFILQAHSLMVSIAAATAAQLLTLNSIDLIVTRGDCRLKKKSLIPH